jgi:hypothetical protein
MLLCFCILQNTSHLENPHQTCTGVLRGFVALNLLWFQLSCQLRLCKATGNPCLNQIIDNLLEWCGIHQKFLGFQWLKILEFGFECFNLSLLLERQPRNQRHVAISSPSLGLL